MNLSQYLFKGKKNAIVTAIEIHRKHKASLIKAAVSQKILRLPFIFRVHALYRSPAML